MPHSLPCFHRLLTAWLCFLTTTVGVAQPHNAPAQVLVVSPPLLQLPAVPPTIEGQLLLRLKPAFQPAASPATSPTVPALAVALQTLGASNFRQKFPHSRPPAARGANHLDLRLLYQVTVPPSLSLAKARAVLLSTGAVEYVEPLYIRQPQYQPNDPSADSTLASGQYYLKSIRAYRAWDIYKGDSSLVIGLTDGGVRLTHEDLRKQIKRNYADKPDGIDNDRDGYIDNFQGWDVANNDNDPGYNANSQANALVHGSQVAGVMSAEADNGRGIAGVGFKCRFLPLNIYANTPTGAFAGFEAIVYAADHGCQVINVSWGAPGGYSRFEQDVINYAVLTRNVVVVAAAGNSNAEARFYPASYDNVISVSGVTAQDVKTTGSTGATYSRRVDLTAPGFNILTTYGADRATVGGPIDADYVAPRGTSFAAPQVAAAAALVRGVFPQYTAAQVAAQLRQTADNTDALPGNAAFVGRMGKGRLNMARALTQTDRREARVVQSRFSPGEENGLPSFMPGQEVQLTTVVVNLLNPLNDVRVTLTSLSPYLTVEQERFAAGSLAPLDSATNKTAPFRLRVAAQGVPLNTIATLQYHLTAANGYESDDFVEIELNPDYVLLDAGNLALTLTSRGNLGFDDVSGRLGRGAVYQDRSSLLSEGGLMLATSPARLSDRLRSVPTSTVRQSFFSLSQARRILNGPSSERADQEARILFQDSLPALNRDRSLGVRVRLRGLSWSTAPRRDFVLLEYTLKNISPDPLPSLLAGLFMDWDLPGEPGRNAAQWDASRQLGYCFDPGAPRQYAGVQLVRGGAPTTYAVDNNAPAGAPVRLNDGFSKAEKYLMLSGSPAEATRAAGLDKSADVSQVVGSNLGTLAAGDSIKVVFAVLAAGSLTELEAAADAAKTAHSELLPARQARTTASSWQVYPNPTSGLLNVELPAAFGPAEAQLTDALGRLVFKYPVRGPVTQLQLAGLPAGAYALHLTSASGSMLSRLVILR